MQIKIIVGCAGPVGSFVAGTTPIVEDWIGNDLIRAGYAELLDAEAQPQAVAQGDEDEDAAASEAEGAGASDGVKPEDAAETPAD